MSHFTVLVIGPDPEEQLKPFDETLEMDRYVQNTKAEIIEKGRKEIEDYKNTTYAEFLNDQQAYAKDHSKEHVAFLENEFPKKLTWSDEEVYQDGIRWYEPEDIGPDGEVYSTSNPNSKWDWYTLGGRWQGFFKCKKGTDTVIGESGAFGPTRKDFTDRCDQGLKSAIDFDGMYNEAADRASVRYEQIANLFGGSIPVVIRTWEDICADESLNTKDLRNATYRAQDAIVAYEELKKTFPTGSPDLTEIQEDFLHGFSWGNELEEFSCTREEYVGKAMIDALSTFAIVKDGKWYEKGQMGWWAIVTNEQDEKEWNTQVQKLIAEASENTLFSLYDCHI